MAFTDTQVKRLPRTADGKLATFFDANGQKYKISSYENGVPPLRYTFYEKLALMFGFNADFNSIFTNINECMEIINRIFKGDNSVNPMQVYKILEAINESVKEASETRYHKALLLCTIFIIRDGEDVSTWDNALAQEKINDWIVEGYGIEDFFYLATLSMKGLEAALKKSMESGYETEENQQQGE